MRTIPMLSPLLFVVSLACVTTDEPFMPGASKVEREAAIKRKLQDAATGALYEANAVLSPPVSDDLRRFWQNAAHNLVEDNATRAEVNQATGHARRIVLTAASNSLPAPGNVRQITQANFNTARLSICPLYPFC